MVVYTFTTNEHAKGIEAAVQALEAGGIVVFPTETCYGIAVDATNPDAVQQLMDYKGGRKNKATSVAVADVKMASEYVEINETAQHLYETFLPGPVTVVSQSLGKVAPRLESERETLGIRMPDYTLVLKLIRQFGKPITATSANTSGKKPPYSLRDLEKYTSDTKLEMISVFLDAGTLSPNPPSTVVDTTMHEVHVIREGAIDFDTLEATAYVGRNEQETRAVGAQLMQRLMPILKKKAVVIAMQGELGAGKTQLTKGIALELGIKEPILSPTYQIMREYEYACGKLGGKLVHIDTWRLSSPEELAELTVEKLLTAGTVVSLEWLEKGRGVIEMWKSKAHIVWVEIAGSGDEQRVIRVADGQDEG